MTGLTRFAIFFIAGVLGSEPLLRDSLTVMRWKCGVAALVLLVAGVWQQVSECRRARGAR